LSSWGDSKRARGAEVNYHCEVCGKFTPAREAVGHHKIYRRDGGKSIKRNLEYRCRRCEEQDAHTFKGRKGRKSHDYNKDRYDEMRVWRFYCRTGRLPER
jgi:5-methylcytosine-specific restriction endonuclease McrA